MKKKLFISMFILLPLVGFSQNSVEFTLGAGNTIVDVESLVEKDEVSGTIASDWGTMNYGFSGQFIFASGGKLNFGGELMYQYMYWYSVQVPYGSQTIYREYSVSTARITPFLRFGGDGAFSFDIGPELNFMDGVVLGLMLSANYAIPVSDNIDIPLKLRVDVMNNIVMTMPISLNAGIRIKL